MKIDILKIKSSFPSPKGHKQGFDSYVASMEQLVKEVISISIFEIEEFSHFISTKLCFQKLCHALPIITMSPVEPPPCTVSIVALFSGEYTHGVGRFLSDQISCYLIPGKHLPITVTRSLNFKFLIQPDLHFYIAELFIEIESARDLHIAQDNFPKLSEEIRLTTLGVEHARKIVLSKAMSIEKKGMILLENLSALIKRPYRKLHHSIFDDTQHILLKATQEKFPDKIPDHILPLLTENSQKFDGLIFDEIQNYLFIFDEAFAKVRSFTHLNKTLSYFYFFQKAITHNILVKPHQRHISFKLQKTWLKYKETSVPILALLIGVNLIADYEILEESTILCAIQEELSNIQLVEGSPITKQQRKEQVRILYLEIKHKNSQPFTSEEVKRLKRKMAKKIIKCIQKTPAPKSNHSEEETMRNILMLSKELKHPNTPPYIIIQFHNQFDTSFHFSVILARVQKLDSLYSTFTNTTQIIIKKTERKVCGILNKRYLKEVYLFDVYINEGKTIAEGRKKLFQFFKKSIYDLHDFNGGMITKQYETLATLKTLIATPLYDPLIESYFYSITPSYVQSLIAPQVLQKHFSLLLHILNTKPPNSLIISTVYNNYALFMMRSNNPSLIDSLKEMAYTFTSDPCDLFATYLKIRDLHMLGFIASNKEIEASFKAELQNILQECKTTACCQLTL